MPQTEANKFAAATRLGLKGVRHKNIERVRQAIRKQDYESSFAWGADGALIAARDGEKRRVSLLEEEWASLQDGVAIHNHPGGNTFSPKDLDRAKQYRLARMEVLTKDCCFMFSPPDSGWEGVSDVVWSKWIDWLDDRIKRVAILKKRGKISKAEAKEKMSEAVSKFASEMHVNYMRIRNW